MFHDDTPMLFHHPTRNVVEQAIQTHGHRVDKAVKEQDSDVDGKDHVGVGYVACVHRDQRGQELGHREICAGNGNYREDGRK